MDTDQTKRDEQDTAKNGRAALNETPEPVESTSSTAQQQQIQADIAVQKSLRVTQWIIAIAAVVGCVITAVYSQISCRQLKTMEAGLILSERSWRDSRRAFLEFVKPVFGELDENGALIQTPMPKPVVWHVGLINRGVITCPNYTVEQACVAALAEEPRAVPCRKMRTVNRPINPGEKEMIEPDWESGDEPSAETLSAVAHGEKNIYVFVAFSYDDGLGGTWARTGCWLFTKKNEFGELVSDPTFHFIWPCRTLNTPEERRPQKKG